MLKLSLEKRGTFSGSTIDGVESVIFFGILENVNNECLIRTLSWVCHFQVLAKCQVSNRVRQVKERRQVNLSGVFSTTGHLIESDKNINRPPAMRHRHITASAEAS